MVTGKLKVVSPNCCKIYLSCLKCPPFPRPPPAHHPRRGLAVRIKLGSCYSKNAKWQKTQRRHRNPHELMFHIFWGRSFIRPHMSFCLNPIRLEFAIFLRLNFPRYLKTFSYLSVMWRKMIKSRSSLGNGLLLFTQQVVSSPFKGVLKKHLFEKAIK